MAIRLLSIALLALLANPASASPFTTPEPEDQYRVTIYIPIEEIPRIPVDNLIKIPNLTCIAIYENGEPAVICFICAGVGGYGNEPLVPNPEVGARRVTFSVAAGYNPSTGWGPYATTGIGPTGNADCAES